MPTKSHIPLVAFGIYGLLLLPTGVVGFAQVYASGNTVNSAEATFGVLVTAVAVLVLVSTLVARIGYGYGWQAVAGVAALAVMPGLSWAVSPTVALAHFIGIAFTGTAAASALVWRFNRRRDLKKGAALLHTIAEVEVALVEVETTWLCNALNADHDDDFTRSELIDIVAVYYGAQTARGLARANRLCVPADVVSDLMDRPAFTESDADRLASGGAL